jgi:hypothetical protein
MAPFGTIYTMMKPVIHPRTRLVTSVLPSPPLPSSISKIINLTPANRLSP